MLLVEFRAGKHSMTLPYPDGCDRYSELLGHFLCGQQSGFAQAIESAFQPILSSQPCHQLALKSNSGSSHHPAAVEFDGSLRISVGVQQLV